MSTKLVPLLLLTVGCTQTLQIGDSQTPNPDSTVSGGDSIDTVDTTDTAAVDSDTGSAPETWPKACSGIYDPDELQEFALDFSPDEWTGIQQDCQYGIQQYRPIEFTYKGETVSAMARLKGNWTWSCDKLQFVVSFNETDPDARFHGLRKVMLDAPWYDRTLLHERLAFPQFAQRGLPYSCANNARVVINGEYYGLYANLERIDQEYLERNFEEPDGNLYQGGVELKTNEDVGDIADQQALASAVTIEQIDALVDLDEAVSEWATEAMIPAMDNYWAGVEINYYLYDHPSRGFVYLPYDMDITFGDSAYPDGSLVWPDSVSSDPITYEHYGWVKEPLVKTVLADPTWCNRFVEELVLARAAYSPRDMADQLDAWNAQIADSLAEDPHRGFSTEDHEASLASLKTFLIARGAFVDNWLARGGQCPSG